MYNTIQFAYGRSVVLLICQVDDLIMIHIKGNLDISYSYFYHFVATIFTNEGDL
jgi:hypothetical protein